MEIAKLPITTLAKLPRIIILCGPTGVGKTALSLKLARELNAEIINADSVQVYRGLDIGAAKASLEERALVPHHLIDILDPDQEHNVGEYRDSARALIGELHKRGKQAIVVGGTGLYIRILVHGLFASPPADEAIRERHRQEAEAQGVPALHARLAQVDPEIAARIHVNDLMRISRGLEILEQTGRPLSELQREHQFQAPHFHALKVALVRPRPELHARIEARVEAMFEAGLERECRALFERYPRETKSLQSLGYRQMAPYLAGEYDLEEARRLILKETKRYAKQQLGWLRSEPGVRWARAPLIDDAGQLDARVIEDCKRFLHEPPTQDLSALELPWASFDSDANPV